MGLSEKSGSPFWNFVTVKMCKAVPKRCQEIKFLVWINLKSKKHPYTYAHECFSAIINMAISVLVYYHIYKFMTRGCRKFVKIICYRVSNLWYSIFDFGKMIKASRILKFFIPIWPLTLSKAFGCRVFCNSTNMFFNSCLLYTSDAADD